MKRLFKSTCWLTFLLTLFVGVYSECKFPNTKMPSKDLKAYQKLKPLLGHRYTVQVEGYIYHIGICTDAIAGQTGDNQGVVQIKTKEGGQSQSVTLGKYTSSSIMAGKHAETAAVSCGTSHVTTNRLSNWVYLQYSLGDSYHSHCGGEPRKAVILFTCDPMASDDSPGMKLLEEENGKDADCYYLFELAHPEVCDVKTSAGSSLSIGSIILIVFFCVMSVYLIAGGLYQRFVLGAKGVEQIPNYEFWKDFGNLQADGCDFVCRAHDARNSSPYKGLGDDQLEEPEERDDNLLPM